MQQALTGADYKYLFVLISRLVFSAFLLCSALKVVREEEERAVRELELRDGCLAMLRDLWSKNIKLGLLTRNCDDGVKAVLKLMGISQSLSSNDLFSQVCSCLIPCICMHVCARVLVHA